ncbi:MAG: hypothetical protein A3F46_00650 [Legionellales bacterium RIFCSPHIGHO2_12_FULL_42_9]|nr:MAG: hypothetical protein A3F46_00650 [Legionellales bacterium RIFCSPHIGHO2_12_FULL_42_9]
MKLFIVLIISSFLSISYSQTLKIGTSGDNPPFSYFSDSHNNFCGFEIDIMMEVCARLHAQCKFQAIVVSDVLKLFADNKVDLVIAAIIEPPANAPDAVDFVFSTPYLPSSAQFLVRADSNIQTLQNIRYKAVGVRLGSLFGGTLFKDYLLSLYNKQLSVTSYLEMCDVIDALQNQMVQAVFSNTEAIHYWYMINKDHFRVVGDPFPIGNGYTIMGKRGDEQLITDINKALHSMEQDGTYTTLYDRYFTLE